MIELPEINKYNEYDLAHWNDTFGLSFDNSLPDGVIREFFSRLVVFGDEAELKIYKQLQQNKQHTKREDYDKKLIGSKVPFSLRRARTELYRLIKCNENEQPEYANIFVTLTFNPDLFPDNYCENLDNVNKEFKAMFRAFKKHLGYPIKFVSVHERHKKTNNIHYHIIFFNLPFIPVSDEYFEKYKSNKVMLNKVQVDFTWSDIWSFGSVDVKKISGIDNIALYISKYIGKEFEDEYGNTLNKKTYTSSRGLVRPQVLYKNKDIEYYLSNAEVQQSIELKNSYTDAEFTQHKLKLNL